jgi:hypothetical protein
MAKHYPYMQWFVSDWLSDPQVSACSCWTRGIWVDWLNCMHQRDRSGALSGTIDQLARMGRCEVNEARSALDELAATGAADVAMSNGVVTLTNRRMMRDAQTRMESAMRVIQHRKKKHVKRKCNATCNTVVTPDTRAGHNSESVNSASASDSAPLTTTTTPRDAIETADEDTDTAPPKQVYYNQVQQWYCAMLKNQKAAMRIADDFWKFNCTITHWMCGRWPIDSSNWPLFAARFLAQDIKRNGNPDLAYRTARVKKIIQNNADEPVLADAAAVANIMEQWRTKAVITQTGDGNVTA